MRLNNPWIGYLERSYEQIKSKLLQNLTVSNPELTDHSENNPLIIILSFFSAVVEMLNYYVDSWAREQFIQTAELYASMVQLASTWDYRIKSNHPETVDVIFTLSDPAPPGGATIPAGTQVTGAGYPYITTSNAIIDEGDTQGLAGAKQVITLSNVNLGIASGELNQEVNLGKKYVYNSVTVEIEGITYDRVETFAFSSAEDYHFIVNVNEEKDSVIRFGDGVTGIIPPVSQIIYVTFDETEGPAGAVGAEEINQIINPPSIPGVADITVTNPNPSSGGSYVEDIESIRKNGPLFVRTLDSAVSSTDYEDLATLYPGVEKAKADFCCGKTVNVIIGPTAGSSGAIASQALLSAVETYFEDLRMYTTCVNAVPAGLSYLVLELRATAKYRKDPLIMSNDITQALLEAYDYNASSINRPIRTSDIIALVDNLDKVDFTTILNLTLIPYPRPISHETQLDWDIQVQPTNPTRKSYLISHPQPGKYTLNIDSQYIGVFDIGVTYIDESVSFTVNPSEFYVLGMEWVFLVYPSGEDIEIEDYSIPVLLESNLTIQGIKSTDNTNCNTNCNAI